MKKVSPSIGHIWGRKKKDDCAGMKADKNK
jgi:hypothetical protein